MLMAAVRMIRHIDIKCRMKFRNYILKRIIFSGVLAEDIIQLNED